MLTGRGTALLVGAVLLWAVGRLLGVPELHVVAVASAALVAVGAVAIRISSATVSVRRGVSAQRLLHGGTAEVTIDLRNDARVPAPLLLVEDRCDWALAEQTRFVVAGLRPSTTTRLTYDIRGTSRGRYHVGPMQLRVRDPFGTTQLVRRYAARDEVMVYPRVETLPEGVTRGNHRGSGTSSDRRLFNAGDEFHTMREYVQGDDLRMIHWPSTAHRHTLMVRQQEMPWQAEAVVFCDTRRGVSRGSGAEATVEKAISAAASIVWHLADHSYSLQLVTEATRQPIGGWQPILDHLAEAEPSEVAGLGPALTRQRGSGAEGLFAAVIMSPPGSDPLGRNPDVRGLLHAGRGYGARLAVIVHTPGLERARAEELAGLLRAARWKAIALPTDVPLADRWRELSGGRATAAAYSPDAS